MQSPWEDWPSILLVMLSPRKETGCSHSPWLLALFNIIIFQLDQPALMEPQGLLNRFAIYFWLSEPFVVCQGWTLVTEVTRQWLAIKVSTLPAVCKHLALLSTLEWLPQKSTESCVCLTFSTKNGLLEIPRPCDAGSLVWERCQTWSSIQTSGSWFHGHIFGHSHRI